VRPISVLLVDGSDIVRAGLVAVLDFDMALHVVGRVPDARRATRFLEQLRPNVVVVRDELPDTTGINFCVEISKRWPEVATVMVMTTVSESSVRKALHAGVRGLVHLDTDPDALHSAVRSAASGLLVLDPRATDRLVNFLRQASLHPPQTLSVREYEVMELVSDGLRSDEIAESLGLSVNSVKTYVRRALEKLGCTSRVEAAARLVRTRPLQEAVASQ